MSNPKTVQGQNVKTVRISGNDYVTVAERNRVAHEIGAELTPGYAIIDEHWFQMNERWFVTITIDVNGKAFKGTSEVKFNAPPKSADAVAPAECAETSALGRALGFAGIGALDSIASADEILRSNADARVEPSPSAQATQRAARPPAAAHTEPHTATPTALPELKPDPSGNYNVGKVRNVLNRSGFKTMAQQDEFLADHKLVLKPSYSADEWRKITDALNPPQEAPTPATATSSAYEVRADIIKWCREHNITSATLQEWCHQHNRAGLVAETAGQLTTLLYELRDTPTTLAELEQLQDELQAEEQMAQQ